MLRKLTTLPVALLIAVGGLALGTSSPATAVANGPYYTCHYDDSGTYLGATSRATGARYTPAQITEYLP